MRVSSQSANGPLPRPGYYADAVRVLEDKIASLISSAGREEMANRTLKFTEEMLEVKMIIVTVCLLLLGCKRTCLLQEL